ncbi:MAG: hypothetical protein F4X26_07655 [Chloroflexi bacterium]|nr:hypothetical protein [Chloroflexota bacterium]
MPRRPRSRRTRSRRIQRPPVPAAGPLAAPDAPAAPERPGARATAASERPARQVARDAPFVRSELVRIGLVSAVCFGLLLALVAIDRLG